VFDAFAHIRCEIQQSGDGAHHQKKNGGNSQQDRQFLGIFHGPGQHFGLGVLFDRIRPQGCQDIPRLGFPRTKGGTVTAIVAQPDVGIAHQFVLQSPGCGNHFLAGKRLGIRRNRTGHRTGGTLVAFFQVFTTQRAHFLDKI